MFSCIILVITIQLLHSNVVNEGLKNWMKKDWGVVQKEENMHVYFSLQYIN